MERLLSIDVAEGYVPRLVEFGSFSSGATFELMVARVESNHRYANVREAWNSPYSNPGNSKKLNFVESTSDVSWHRLVARTCFVSQRAGLLVYVHNEPSRKRRG